ncbi:ABC transporter substrate-binding protein [Bosea sp. PAMC 26642]|uniref:ABC transporter substrate-binding protein n=1 Tax=Bosea sp. (strain PAMC 26642) TaxID=1792307 RepID=UPI0007705BF3|nr:ABC transporter substrate-binding protein [Bosea sp. PAMC 26642]AMJ63860.1 4-phytase [Bosea sp. PAMC 26642]
MTTLRSMVSAAALSLAIFAPSLTVAPSPAFAKGILKLAQTQDLVSLDPIATSDNASIFAQLLVFDTLLRPSKDATKLEPGLAESWQVSADGLTYSFKLREAKFSDGTPVTAGDVAFSLKRAGSDASNWKRFFAGIDQIETPDDRTVVLKLKKVFTPLLNNLALFSSAILPQKAFEAASGTFFEKPIGSGPFTVAAWNKGQGLSLKKNANYWQAGKPDLDGAELMVIPEGNSRVLKLQAGEIDAALEIPLNQMQGLSRAGTIKTAVANVLRSDFVLMNTKKKPFDDVRVRQALNYAIDKEGLVKALLYGAGKVSNSPMPPMAYADPDLKPYAHDIAKAKALLKEAGYADGFKTSLLVHSGRPLHRQLGQALQSALAQIGVTAEIRLVEGGTHWSTTKAGDYEMAVSYASSDTIDPDQMAGFLIVNPERANAYHTEWKSERVNELYEKERATNDGPERGAMFKEMVKLAHEGSPSIFLFYPGTSYAYRSNVEGFEVLPTSNFRLEDVKLK